MSDDAGLIRRLNEANRGAEKASPADDPEENVSSGGVDDRALGRQLAGMLKARDYHPVVVVGANDSGKTTFLASLLARAYSSSKESCVDFRLAEECLFPPAHPLRAEIEIQTSRFYDGTVVNFADWQQVAATRFEHPFFVPIEMIPTKHHLPAIRLAFLESRGETFNPDVERVKVAGSEQQYLRRKKLPDHITSMLMSFDRPVTFIYLAPCVASDELKQRKADTALFQGLEQILAIRMPTGMYRSDRHLFLLSRWDEYTGGVSARAFRRPYRAETDHVLTSRFPNSWRRFASLRSESSEAQYFQMHYSVGPVKEGQLARVAGDARRTLNRFPRIVLNWLYTGATGEVLFADVLPPPAPRWNLLDWITCLIRFGTIRT